MGGCRCASRSRRGGKTKSLKVASWDSEFCGEASGLAFCFLGADDPLSAFSDGHGDAVPLRDYLVSDLHSMKR